MAEEPEFDEDGIEQISLAALDDYLQESRRAGEHPLLDCCGDAAALVSRKTDTGPNPRRVTPGSPTPDQSVPCCPHFARLILVRKAKAGRGLLWA